MAPQARSKAGSALILVVIAGVGVFAMGKYVVGMWKGESSAPVAQSAAPAVSSAPSPVASAAPVAALPKSPPIISLAPAIEKFRERFGHELVVEQDRAGQRVVRVRGAPGSGKRGSPSFSPEDPQKAIARAKDVLKGMRDLLGVSEELPLATPIAKTGAVSAQVYFKETYQGVELGPSGSVTVDLGAQGEVLNVNSDYVPKLTVGNERKLDAERAKVFAQAAITDAGHGGLKAKGGNPVVWVVPGGWGGSQEGLHAYEYNVQGWQVIVDAGSGEVLSRQDQRQH